MRTTPHKRQLGYRKRILKETNCPKRRHKQAMLRLKVALSDAVEATRLAQERSDADSRQNRVNMLDPRQVAGNIGETDDGASLDDNEECERRMRPFRKGEGERPSSNSGETAAYCHDETSRDDKDTGRSRSSSHLLHHDAASIGGGACSRSIKMDCVQADDALSELAETREPVNKTNRQGGFVMLSMSMLQDHALLETCDAALLTRRLRHAVNVNAAGSCPPGDV